MAPDKMIVKAEMSIDFRATGFILIAIPIVGMIVLAISTGDAIEKLASKILIYPAYWAVKLWWLLLPLGIVCLIISLR